MTAGSRLLYPCGSFCLFIFFIRALTYFFVLHFRFYLCESVIFAAAKLRCILLSHFKVIAQLHVEVLHEVVNRRKCALEVIMNALWLKNRWRHCLSMTYIYWNLSLLSKILMLLTSCNISYAANIPYKCHRSSKLSSRKKLKIFNVMLSFMRTKSYKVQILPA